MACCRIAVCRLLERPLTELSNLAVPSSFLAAGSASGDRRSSSRSGPELMFGYADYYVAAAALALGSTVIGVTRWIECRRAKNPMPHVVPTTPFMVFGTLVVLLAIGYAFTVSQAIKARNLEFRGSAGQGLTSSEIAEFKAHLSQCWVPAAGIASTSGTSLLIRVTLDQRGSLATEPEPTRAPVSLSGPVLLESAMRALQQCQPYDFLPAAKYQQWRVLDLGFSSDGPSEVRPVLAKDLLVR